LRGAEVTGEVSDVSAIDPRINHSYFGVHNSVFIWVYSCLSKQNLSLT
jgi:hypothetical protein